MSSTWVDRARRVRLPGRAVGSVAAGWVAGRIVVFGALALAHYIADEAHAPATSRLHAVGLLGWDASYYRDTAALGYSHLPPDALRFFPLVPMVVWVLGLGGHAAGPILLVVVNLVAFGYGLALVRLLRAEGWDEALAGRVGWLVALVPPAFVLVMGYAEAVAGLATVLGFLALRRRRWWWAALAGLAVGLARPNGVLFAAPALIEAVRVGRPSGMRDWCGRIAAVLAPLAGAAGYLGYVGIRFGDALEPYRIQTEAARHGGIQNPLRTISDAAHAFAGGHIGTGLHLPWLVVFVILLVVMARRLPASYTVWAGLVLLAGLLGSNLDSLERYCFAAFPFVLAVVLLLRRWPLWPAILAVSGGLLASYSTLAFLGLYVP